jgi:hypothetical protein
MGPDVNTNGSSAPIAERPANYHLGDRRDFRHCGREVPGSINVGGLWPNRGSPMVIASELKPGMFLRIEGEIYWNGTAAGAF